MEENHYRMIKDAIADVMEKDYLRIEQIQSKLAVSPSSINPHDTEQDATVAAQRALDANKQMKICFEELKRLGINGNARAPRLKIRKPHMLIFTIIKSTPFDPDFFRAGPADADTAMNMKLESAIENGI